MVKNLLAAAFLSTSLANAIVVSNYTAAANDRFTNDPSFIGALFDFSGVGRSTDPSRTAWATLIGANYFISADHYHPLVGSTIQFSGGNSPSSPTFTYTVAGGFLVPGTDFWIGYTASAMDITLPRYSLNTTPAATIADTGVAGVNLFTMGDQIPGEPGGPMAQTVGSNQGESFFATGSSTMASPQTTITFTTPAAFDQIVVFENLPGDNTLNFTPSESQGELGDSGSPLFAVSNGSLVLQGTAWAVANLPGNFIDTPGAPGSPTDPIEDRNATFYTYTGSYQSAIAATIAMIPSPPPIPEPSTLLLIFSSLPLLFAHRRH